MKHAAILLLAPLALAQAPANAPAGSTGICKDGSYTTAPQRGGACHGHKGIQTWYAIGFPARPAPAPATLPTVPAPTPDRAAKPLPAPTPAALPTLPAPAAATVPTLPAPQAATLPTRPAPTATTLSTRPAPGPGQVDVRYGIANERSRIVAATPAPGGGPGLVWLNTATHVYHCPTSDFYGKTRNGIYTTEADAKAQGGHPNRNKPCS